MAHLQRCEWMVEDWNPFAIEVFFWRWSLSRTAFYKKTTWLARFFALTWPYSLIASPEKGICGCISWIRTPAVPAADLFGCPQSSNGMGRRVTLFLILSEFDTGTDPHLTFIIPTGRGSAEVYLDFYFSGLPTERRDSKHDLVYFFDIPKLTIIVSDT